MIDYIEITHSGTPVRLSTFIESYDVVLTETFSIQSLIDYNGNGDRIKLSLLPSDDYSATGQVLIYNGVTIRIPKDSVSREIIATSGNLVIPNSNFDAFIEERIREIVEDTNYKPISSNRTASELGNLYKFADDITVWIWSKALSKIINVTGFVESISTNVGPNGGNFSIRLAPAVGEVINSDWNLQRGTSYQYMYADKRNFLVRSGDSSYKKHNNNDQFKQRNFLFNNIIQSNDLVFIKFETLRSESEKRNTENAKLNIDSIVVDPSMLEDMGGPGGRQLFDMIGLVDTNVQNRDAASANTSISVSGRDLMKLLLEDGEYFFPTDISGISAGIQGDTSGRAINRLVSGEFNFFNAYLERTVDFTIRFVIYMLSNIKIVDSDLFKYYTDRTTRYSLSKDIDEETSTEQLNEEFVDGIWQIIKLVIDPNLQNRRIVDSSIVSDQGSLKSFIDSKVIQQPFAEFYGDTYGNKYYLIARKPPFNRESYISNSKNAIQILESDIFSESINWSDEEVYSWYRLIPRGNFFGDDESLALTYFPAIFFEQYADIWGSRPYQIVTNYIDYQGIRGDKSSVNLDFLVEQAYQDLSFVIQSYAYLPFSRKGTITLKGDRRIKRGNMIKHTGTDEYYYVESVSNSFNVNEGSVDRTTTVVVTRGLKADFVKGKEVTFLGKDGQLRTKFISYFDIIKMVVDDNGIIKSKDMSVDDDVFEFFIRRLQMA